MENTGSTGFCTVHLFENTGSAGHSTGFCLVETGSIGFKTGSTGFCTVHFFLPVCCVSQKVERSFLKNRFNRFWDRFNRFWDRFNRFLGQKSQKRLVLEPHLYILCKSPRGEGVNRQSEIYRLGHTLQAGVSVRNINESKREGENKSQANKNG